MINSIVKVNLMGNQKYLIFAFGSRNYLYSFQNNLTGYGIASSIINTPRNITTNCGLSLKVDFRFFNAISNIIKSHPTGLIGIYIADYTNGKENLTKI